MICPDEFQEEQDADFTPFVEVLMVLMGTFVVLIAVQIHGIESKLSEGEPGRSIISSNENALLVQIDDLDRISVDGTEVTLQGVVDLVKELTEKESLERVMLIPEEKASYGLGMRLKTAVTKLGDFEIIELYRPKSE